MQHNQSVGFSLILMFAVLSGLVSMAHAQDTDDQAAVTPAEIDEVDAQIADIRTGIAEINRLKGQIDNSSPGLRELLQRRVDEQGNTVADQINKLAGDVLDREENGDFDQNRRDQSIVLLELVAPWVEQFLQRNSAIIATRLSIEASLSPAEAAASAIEMERDVAASVQANKMLNEFLNNLERFDVDVTERRTLVTSRAQEAAETLAVAVQMSTEELQKLRYRLTLTPDDAELQTLIKVTELKRSGFARNLGSLSDLLQELGINPSQYRSLVLVVTGDVASQLLDTGVMSELARQWSKAGWQWINSNGLTVTVKFIVFFLILFGFRALSRLIRRATERGMERVNLSVLLRSMIVSSAANAVMALGFFIALSQIGVSLGPLLAGLGVLGFIVGFALQDTLGNFAAGMMILMYRPYDVGDVITAGGVTGKVKDMSLVYTMILTFDNQKMIVPNNRIWGDVIQNVTAQRVRRVDMVFGISYSDDIEKAEKVFAEIIDEHELTLDDPEPMIHLHTLNESSVDFVVRPWVKSADYWDVYWDITREVKMRFDREGISIPFPQRDVHHHYEQAPPLPATT